MTRRSHLDPGAFDLPGGPLGVLLLHGYTGSPPEMRLLGEYLHSRGMTVLAPLLPGHGTTVDDMNRSRWRDWTGCAQQALAELRRRCPLVFVGGLSMGTLLTLYLAEQHADLPGAMLYSPALKVAERRLALAPLAKHFVRSLPKGANADQDLTDPSAAQHLWSYEENPVAAAAELLALRRQVQRRLAQVACPLLIVHSTHDPAIRPDSAQAVYDGVSTPAAHKTLLTLHNSGHVLLVDSEWEYVAEQTARFIYRWLPSPSVHRC
ncbi:MAG: alpha/beta fold hydrolase [Anaerolineae bacterium]